MNTSEVLNSQELDSEITWSEGLNNHVVKSDLGLLGCYRLGNGVSINVYSNNPGLIGSLDEKFEQGEDGIHALHFIDKKCPAVGGIDMTQSASTVIGSGFGILKSAMSGIATRISGDLAIHGSAIGSSDIGGLCMVGGHRAGKTTGILNIAHILESGKVVSDDWITTGEDRYDRNLKSTDPSISVSSTSVEENRHIPQLQADAIKEAVQLRKRSYRPQELLGQSFQDGDINLDAFIILVSGLTEPVVDISTTQDIKDVVRFIIEATYHYPFSNKEETRRHLEGFEKKIQTHGTGIFMYDRSQARSLVHGYELLLEKIRG